MSRRGTSRANRVLQDAREYRDERQTMNNPKNWGHVIRSIRRFERAGGYSEIPDAEREFGITVLERLARLDA